MVSSLGHPAYYVVLAINILKKLNFMSDYILVNLNFITAVKKKYNDMSIAVNLLTIMIGSQFKPNYGYRCTLLCKIGLLKFNKIVHFSLVKRWQYFLTAYIF